MKAPGFDPEQETMCYGYSASLAFEQTKVHFNR